MLGINCLIDNSSILPQLKETVEYVGYKVLEGGNKATIENVYNTMRKLGIEVDMQTVSHIYQEVFDSNDELFSTREEVESAREDIFRRIAEKKVVTGKQQIGRDNPSTTVAGSIASMLQDLGKRSPSAQKELEQGLKKVATKIMAQNPDSFPKAEREVETVEEILNRVFRSEEGQAMTVNEVEGKMNTAKELFEQFKEDIATLADEMAKKDAIGADKLMQFANIIQQSGYDLFLSQKEVKRVIDEALSDAGFTKEVTDKEGNKKTVTDWNKVISSNIDFKESLRTALKAKGFSDAQISSITPSLVRDFQALRAEKIKTKLNPKESEAKVVERVPDIDKLVSLNNMGIFEGENRKQLYKFLGVAELDEKSIAVIEKVSNLIKMLDSRSKLSPTFIKSINRLIEIELNKIQDKGLLLKIANGFASYAQWANGLLISNVLNTVENATSALMQTLYTLATDPKNGMRYLRGAVTVMGDILQGGVREGVNYSDAFSANVNISDKYNFETANSVKSHIWSVANTLTRSVLETFDSSAKAAMTNKMFQSTIKKTLMKQGMTADEADAIINETLYGNNKEIDALAESLTKTLEEAGLNIIAPGTKTNRIANELRRANIVSNGTFFQSVIEDLIAKRVISEKARDIKIDENVFNGILNAAEATAGKGLGHASDNKLFREMFDKPSQRQSKKLSEARKEGNKNKIAGQLAINTGGSLLSRFVGGAARWSWLSFQKVSGLALAQTILTDIVFTPEVMTKDGKLAFNKNLIGRYLNFKKLSDNFDLEYKDGKPVRDDGKSQAEYDIETYLSLRERLKREIIGPLVGYTLASAVLPMLAKMLGFGYDDDDSDEKKADKVSRLMFWLSKPEQRDIRNIINKVGFIQLMAYMGTIAKKDKYGQPFYIDPKEKDNDILKTAYNLNVLNSIFLENFNKGGSFNILKDLDEANRNQDGSPGKVLVRYGTELSNIGAPFKFWDMNKGAINGIMQGKTEGQPKAETLKDQFLKSALTRDMFRSYMEKKD